MSATIVCALRLRGARRSIVAVTVAAQGVRRALVTSQELLAAFRPTAHAG